MRRYLFLMVFLIFSFGCESTKVNHRVVQMEDVINQMKENDIIDESLFREKVPAQINEDEIRIVDSLLILGVEKFNFKQKESERTINHLIDIENYQCNYIPTLNEKGEKVVYIIATIADSNEPWWEVYQILKIHDGYISVFRSSVNLSQKQGGNILPNGEA